MDALNFQKMVNLTAAYVEKKCSQTQASKSLTKELQKNHLNKITHLYMNDKFIHTIGNFAACKNLRVIYLHNNCISKIVNLHFATNITHLYLQRNKISKIENLDCLKNLTALFLGHNNISVVEGLENLENLIELNIERQELPSGESLCFEPRTCQTLSLRVDILNVNGNKLTSLNEIGNFQMLRTLEAKDNSIEDIKDLTKTVESLKNLKELWLQGNPVTRCYRYRENMIANTDSLVNLDGKDITPVCRQFMKKFKIERHLQQTTKRSKLTLRDDITSSLNLPPAFKRSVSRAIFQNPGPKLSITVTSASGELQPQVFPPWKLSPSIKGFGNSHLTPRPLWRSSHGESSKRKLSLKCDVDGSTNRMILPPI